MRRMIISIALVAAFIATAYGHPSHPERPNGGRSQATVHSTPLSASDGLARAEAYAQAVEDLTVVVYLKTQGDLVAAYLTANAPPPPPVSSRQVPQVANTGAHSDAWWRGVAQCEQGGRNDSFFGYFSIMDGSAGGLDWSTQVAMANAIISRSGDGAWAQSCQDAGYAASPGG